MPALGDAPRSCSTSSHGLFCRAAPPVADEGAGRFAPSVPRAGARCPPCRPTWNPGSPLCSQPDDGARKASFSLLLSEAHSGGSDGRLEVTPQEDRDGSTVLKRMCHQRTGQGRKEMKDRLATRVPTQQCWCMARAILTSSPQGPSSATHVPKATGGAGPRGVSIHTRPASSENNAVPDRSGLSRSGRTGIAGSLPTAPMVPGGRPACLSAGSSCELCGHQGEGTRAQRRWGL